MPIFRVKSVKIYTGQKKFTRVYPWDPWQIWGMLRWGKKERCRKWEEDNPTDGLLGGPCILYKRTQYKYEYKNTKRQGNPTDGLLEEYCILWEHPIQIQTLKYQKNKAIQQMASYQDPGDWLSYNRTWYNTATVTRKWSRSNWRHWGWGKRRLIWFDFGQCSFYWRKPSSNMATTAANSSYSLLLLTH